MNYRDYVVRDWQSEDRNAAAAVILAEVATVSPASVKSPSLFQSINTFPNLA